VPTNFAHHLKEVTMTATDTDTELDPVAEEDDSGGGLAMFVIFTAAVLIVTGAVAMVALVNGGWWVLGLAFTVHVFMTVVVVATIVHVMAGRPSATSQDEPEPARPRPAPGRATSARMLRERPPWRRHPIRLG
jgi:fatty acid desaturase